MINIRIPQQAILGIFGLVAVLFCLTAWYVIAQWRADWQLSHRSFISKPVVANNIETARGESAVPEMHLFGQSLATSGQIPITSLQFHVTGIVKVNNDQGNSASKAYISVGSQVGKIYHIGDKLPYGVKVFDITADAVMLENNGRLEKLPLPREQLQFKPRTKERL